MLVLFWRQQQNEDPFDKLRVILSASTALGMFRGMVSRVEPQATNGMRSASKDEE